MVGWVLTGDQNLAHGEALFVGSELVRAPQIERLAILLALFAAPFRNSVHHDGCASLGDQEEVYDLGGAAEDELDPNVPAPGKELFNKTSDYGAQDGTAD